jgi:hypothetical protein
MPINSLIFSKKKNFSILIKPWRVSCQRLVTSFLGLALFFTLTACGDQADNGKADRHSNDGSAGIAGKWKGNFTSKDSEEGSSLKDTAAAAVFKADDNKSGEFSITLPRLDDVYAEGTYADMGDGSMMFDVDKSTLSLIGLPGSTPDLKYEYIGNALVLYNDRIRIKLIRDTDDEDEEINNGSGTSGPLAGTWLCKEDTTNRKWKISIPSSVDFFAIDITLQGHSAVWQKGIITTNTGDKKIVAILSVTESLYGVYDGNIYNISNITDKSMILTVTKSEDELNGQDLSCSKD